MKKDLLVFCVNNNHCMMPSEFFWSYHRMMKPNGSFAVQGSASVKSSSINDGIYQALQLGAEWMFLMDVDQLFQVNTIPKLLESCKKYDAKIMSVQYQIGKMPYAHVAGWLKEIQYKGQTEYKFVNSKGDPWKGTYAPLGEGVVEGDWNTIWQTEHLKNKTRDENCAYGETFKNILDQVPLNVKVADVGSGPGFLMEYLRKEKGAVCTGYDFSSEAIEILKKKGFDGHVSDFRSYSPNGDKATFDVVVSTHTIEHIKDDAKFLETLKALCKPGGKVVVATPWVEEIQGHFEHVRGYSDLELDKLMSEHFKEFSVTKNKRDYIAVGVNA